MNWIIENWVAILLVGGMLVFHLFGHGHGRRQSDDPVSRVANKKRRASHDQGSKDGRIG